LICKAIKNFKNIVLEHIENHKNSKEAFNEENLKTLKLGKNLIKRVRVLQKKIKTTKKQTAEDILQQTKFGVKDKSGKIFKYMSYGNNHHTNPPCFETYPAPVFSCKPPESFRCGVCETITCFNFSSSSVRISA
jgi:hypothetical protein